MRPAKDAVFQGLGPQLLRDALVSLSACGECKESRGRDGASAKRADCRCEGLSSCSGWTKCRKSSQTSETRGSNPPRWVVLHLRSQVPKKRPEVHNLAEEGASKQKLWPLLLLWKLIEGAGPEAASVPRVCEGVQLTLSSFCPS